MRQIELWTGDGHFVAVVEIAPFPDKGMPAVVLWGERIFANPRGVGRWRYNEVFAVASVTPSPGFPLDLDPDKPAPSPEPLPDNTPTSVLGWPGRPTCHDGAPRIPGSPAPAWEKRGSSVRQCSYCGSIHPADLLDALGKPEVKLGGSDWKYGWPHKFYVDGVAVQGAGKFYNEHLLDAGFGEAHRAQLLAAIKEHSGIEFFFEEGKLKFRAPHQGYQR